MILLESGENYLEAILMLQQEKGYARSVDVAVHMGLSKPSVSRAVGLLRKEGYITVNTDGHLLFTEKGLKKASDVLERHRTLTEFLETVIHVSPEIAEKDACRIEHILSPETFAGIKRLTLETRQKR